MGKYNSHKTLFAIKTDLLFDLFPKQSGVGTNWDCKHYYLPSFGLELQMIRATAFLKMQYNPPPPPHVINNDWSLTLVRSILYFLVEKKKFDLTPTVFILRLTQLNILILNTYKMSISNVSFGKIHYCLFSVMKLTL